MIDLHTHVLPGLDDGAPNLAEALAILRAVREDGVQVLAATPHVRADYPTTAEEMEDALATVRTASVDLGVEILAGGELDFRQLDRPVSELARFGLGGNPCYLLIETPYAGWPLELPEALFRLLNAGITPVLAHPERNVAVQARPERLAQLVAAGCLVQITAASVAGRFDSGARRAAKALIRLELAHLVASDIHGPNRAGTMRAACAAFRDERLARWLTEEVPAAIVSGDPVPHRPERGRVLRRPFRARAR